MHSKHLLKRDSLTNERALMHSKRSIASRHLQTFTKVIEVWGSVKKSKQITVEWQVPDQVVALAL